MTIATIINSLNRYNQKRKMRNLVRGLPGDMQPSAMHDLLQLIDVPERQEKVMRTREIFKALKAQIDAQYESEAISLRDGYTKQFERAAGNVVAAGFPIPRLHIDHSILEQKAKAKMTLADLEDEILEVPQTSRFNLVAACLGVSLSVAATYLTISSFFGNDWVGANETITATVNSFISIIVVLFETLGFYIFLHFTPRRKSHHMAKLIGRVGAVLIIISICIMIFARSEIGTNTVTKTQDAGQVE